MARSNVGKGLGCRLLAVETASGSPSIALSDGRKVWRRKLRPRGQDDALPREAGRLLDKAGLGVRDLDLLVAARGPGSFTGIRVGMTFVSILGRAIGRPAAAVSLFEAEAWRAARALEGGVPPVELVVALIPAPRGQLYFQPFEAGDPPRPAGEPGWASGAEWPAAFEGLARGRIAALAGCAAAEGRRLVEGSSLLAPALILPPLSAWDLAGPALRFWPSEEGRTAAAPPGARGRSGEPEAFEPLYVRPAYFERGGARPAERGGP